ncbi:MAG: FMN-binding protein [Microbacterium sp. SCN 70-27]|uniref:FMN-binding protein n=1 Tax=unclassified Microbacterium TaxID=2609290 RepID=UPI00086C0EE1|nr:MULTISPECIES: FMN-binding protein [unclassified Microbacterium]MBN9223986.1 FMN-binding protein [Microbacterium sp.]ODT26901.1 MAG: FMN-binding protein [Microbacterium sp. SCN 70-27]
MKRIVYALLATFSGLVLLFSYRTSLGEAVALPPEVKTDTVASTSSTGASGATGGSSSATPAPSATAAQAPASSSGLTDGTFTGSSVNTRYGPVQVQITVSGGTITDVQAVDYPDGNGRDRQINQSAIPRLVSETLSAQSAQIDFVSGATYTSDGYQQSLQSAIDQAAS